MTGASQTSRMLRVDRQLGRLDLNLERLIERAHLMAEAASELEEIALALAGDDADRDPLVAKLIATLDEVIVPQRHLELAEALVTELRGRTLAITR